MLVSWEQILIYNDNLAKHWNIKLYKLYVKR